MATPMLNISPLEYFTPVFIFLLVFVIFYAIMQKTKVVGGNTGVNALISFVVAILFVITSAAADLIRLVTPWFVVLLIVAMAMIMLFMFLGVKAESIAGAVSDSGTVWTILIVLMVLFGAALTQVIGPSIAAITQGGGTAVNATATGGGTTFVGGVGKIIFSPKILGVFFLLIVASQAIKTITKSM